MLRPIGNLPPEIYWRRRAWFAAGTVAVIALLVWAFSGGAGGGPKAGAGVASATPTPTSPAAATSSRSSTAKSDSTKPTKSHGAGKSTRSPGSTPTVKTCQLADLVVTASTGKKSYPRTAQPLLVMQVVNVGTTPCQQNLADSQIELRVYTGNVRFWDSHDCGIRPGTDLVTLRPNQPARRGVIWAGHTSRPGCTGTALNVEPGTYTLIASLAKQSSIPVPFTIT